MNNSLSRFRANCFVKIILSILVLSSLCIAQSSDELRINAKDLIKQSKLTEAVPVLERLIDAEPRDADAYEMLGTALLGLAVNTSDQEERQRVRFAARQAFIRSRDLGNGSNFVRAMIGSLPMDGSDSPSFSDVPASHALTYEGEQAFTQGKIDEALDLYKRAHEADPKNYFAPLFAGDMYVKKEDFSNAEVWYQKAIKIDPNKETAYRYSATPLMKQKKYDIARDRYIEAWITEPYSRFALNGMIQWGEVTGTHLGHPTIDVPKTVIGADGKSNTTINVNPLAEDGSMAWIAYSATRETWKEGKFAKTFPGERQYRHSLAEEADALRSVVSMAKSLKIKKLGQQIETLARLDSEGLLEPFILMAMPDPGIAIDHPVYLKTNRAKLREYVVKYVIARK